MTGRWMMAAIQMTFAVMPALVYWFAGWTQAHGSAAITIGTLVAFTTLQTRLFFPIGSLLGVQLEVQSSLALFDRIFEYLDRPIDIVEGTRTLDRPRGDVVFEDVCFRYDEDAWTLKDVSFTVPAGTKTALVGETGSGKTTCGYLVARLYDATRGTRHDRRRRRARPHLRVARGHGRRRLPGDVPLPRDRPREPALREARRDRRGGRGGRAGRADPRADRLAPRRLRHRRRRARLPLLGRREAAHGDRAHDPSQPADPRPRRGDLRARHADRARSSRRRSSGSPRAARRSRSPTASRPSATPTRSSCSTAATSSSAGRTRSCSRSAAATRRSSSVTP